MSQRFSIDIKIAERTYNCKVEEKYVDIYKKSAKKINDYISILQHNYKHAKDITDFLALAALRFTVNSSSEQLDEETFKFIENIRDITDDLDEYLQKKT